MITAEDINIKELRALFPKYVWTAKHAGMSYEYFGAHPDEPHKNVRVYKRSAVVDASRELYETQTFVETSIDTYRLFEWALRYRAEFGD